MSEWRRANEWITNSSDEGLTLETSAFVLVTVANLHFQLSWYNQTDMYQLSLVPINDKRQTGTSGNEIG